jgi:hypothetical protein
MRECSPSALLVTLTRRTDDMAGRHWEWEDIPLSDEPYTKYPIKDMVVGGKCLTIYNVKKNSIRWHLRQARRKWGYEFTMRSIGIEAGYRIWRIK